MGPLITKEHRDKVASYLETGVSQGATLRADGRQHVLYNESEGFFLGVSLLDNVTPEMECYRNEIFGPVLEVVRAHDYPEALEIVNDNQYGNGTAIFTRDGGAARQYQFDVNVGMVGINVPIPVPVAYYSFGGWKASLFGDLHMYGPEGIQFYTRGKVVTARWPDPGTSRWISGSRERATARTGGCSWPSASPALIHLIAAWLLVVGLLVQVFLAGMGIFDDASSFATHRDFGHLARDPAGHPARDGDRRRLRTVARARRRGLLALLFLQTILVLQRDSAPVVAALHPVNGFLSPARRRRSSHGLNAAVADEPNGSWRRDDCIPSARPADASHAAVRRWSGSPASTARRRGR